MKARTKLQLRVSQLSSQLPKLTDAQECWAKKICLEHKGFATKNRCICLDCGSSFSTELIVRKRATCPHCQTRIKVELSAKRTDKQSVYFAIADIIEDFQIVRFYDLRAYYKAGKAASYYCYQVMQHWILPDGKREVIGLNHHYAWSCDSWGGDWQIRNKKYTHKYDIYPFKYHPSSRIKKQYRKYGIDRNLRGMTFLNAIKIVPENPKAETLLKAKRFDFLRQVTNNGYCKVSRYWPSVKICLRNKYVPSDFDIWIDYLELLQYFQKDLHNAKFVCPVNLKLEHDRLMEKKREIQRMEAVERKRHTIEKAQPNYAKRIKKFEGLEFSDGKITVKLLETVSEFMVEGDVLRHCVFTNDYFTKKDSLVLSARIDGVPIETVEISLSQMRIVQSRGFKNKPSEFNKQIVSLVTKHLPIIKKMKLQKSA